MSTLTAEETELYDRQIRAWGFEAQKRMRESKILIVGLDGAGSENLKNLVLAGLGNITILDDQIVNNTLIETHFYLTPKHLDQAFADVALTYFSEMNPNIALSTCTENPLSKSDDYYKSFDVVIICNYSRSFQLRINAICNVHNIGFFSCRSIGSFGYIFADLQDHHYQIKSKSKQKNDGETKENDDVDNKVIETLKWYSLKSALSVSNKSLNKQLKRKQKRFKNLFYCLQILEECEEKILQKNKYFEGNSKHKSAEIHKAIKCVKDQKSEYFEAYLEIAKNVNESGQFDEKDMKNDEMMDILLNVWNLSVCPSNAMLGGYLANFVMFYVQRKQKPLHNFLFFDMWSNEALEVLMMNEKDQKEKSEKDKEQKEKRNKKKIVNGNGANVDISELSVEQNVKNNDQVVLDLLDSDDDNDNGDDTEMIDID